MWKIAAAEKPASHIIVMAYTDTKEVCEAFVGREGFWMTTRGERISVLSWRPKQYGTEIVPTNLPCPGCLEAEAILSERKFVGCRECGILHVRES